MGSTIEPIPLGQVRESQKYEHGRALCITHLSSGGMGMGERADPEIIIAGELPPCQLQYLEEQALDVGCPSVHCREKYVLVLIVDE